jgi:mannan endo-1,4-beta-mannosidase
MFSQEVNFITAKSENFFLNGEPFFFSGANVYYAQSLVAYSYTNSIDEVFSNIKTLGMNVIRIWGFYDSDDTNDPAVIQYSPGCYNESGLRALDYVLLKAEEYELKVVVTLVNNWENYGGMNQYVEWLSKSLPAKKAYWYKNIFKRKNTISRNGMFYRQNINGYSHDDFFSNTTIKEWYKNYVKMILTRTNIYKNIQYKDDPAIFAFELANEAESSDNSGKLINSWITEMAAFIKSIDNSHLIGTGESGFDVNSNNYSDLKSQYNGQNWLLNGEKGVSYYLNLKNENIDFGSCHLYKEDWQISAEAGKIWIEDHKNISHSFNKPFLLGEYGSRYDKANTYLEWLKTIETTNSSGALLWQLVYDSRTDDDGFFVYYSKDKVLCNILSDFYEKMTHKEQIAEMNEKYVSQNYPNPCNNFTTFEYYVPFRSSVKIMVYNTLGQELFVCSDQILDQGFYTKGINTSKLSSGVYFVKFSINGNQIVKKMQIIK